MRGTCSWRRRMCHNGSKSRTWVGFPGAPLPTSVTQAELLFLIPTSLICQMGTVVTLSISLCYGCLNKLPQTSCLNQHKHITYGSGGQKSSNRGVGSLCSFWRRWGQFVYSPFPASGVHLQSVAGGLFFHLQSPLALLYFQHPISFSNSDPPACLLLGLLHWALLGHVE